MHFDGFFFSLHFYRLFLFHSFCLVPLVNYRAGRKNSSLFFFFSFVFCHVKSGFLVGFLSICFSAFSLYIFIFLSLKLTYAQITHPQTCVQPVTHTPTQTHKYVHAYLPNTHTPTQILTSHFQRNIETSK